MNSKLLCRWLGHNWGRPNRLYPPCWKLRFELGIVLLIVTVLLLTGCGGKAPAPPAPPTLTPAQERGKALFSGPPANCATCHSLTPDTQIVGPSLAGVATRAEERMPGLSAREYLELSIVKPGAYVVDGYPDAMPTNLAKQITSDQLNDLVEFLLTLK